MPDLAQFEALGKNVRERMSRGEEPEEAVPAALRELGITDLDETVIPKIVDGFKVIKRSLNDPEFTQKQVALERRIRRLIREGKTIAQAVAQAQEDTGVKLRPEGSKMLIDILEKQFEQMRDVRIEVVSDEEYAELVNVRCMFFQQDGQDGWRCCKCQTLRSLAQTHCPCGHERCALN